MDVKRNELEILYKGYCNLQDTIYDVTSDIDRLLCNVTDMIKEGMCEFYNDNKHPSQNHCFTHDIQIHFDYGDGDIEFHIGDSSDFPSTVFAIRPTHIPDSFDYYFNDYAISLKIKDFYLESSVSYRPNIDLIFLSWFNSPLGMDYMHICNGIIPTRGFILTFYDIINEVNNLLIQREKLISVRSEMDIIYYRLILNYLYDRYGFMSTVYYNEPILSHNDIGINLSISAEKKKIEYMTKNMYDGTIYDHSIIGVGVEKLYKFLNLENYMTNESLTKFKIKQFISNV